MAAVTTHALLVHGVLRLSRFCRPWVMRLTLTYSCCQWPKDKHSCCHAWIPAPLFSCFLSVTGATIGSPPFSALTACSSPCGVLGRLPQHDPHQRRLGACHQRLLPGTRLPTGPHQPKRSNGPPPAMGVGPSAQAAPRGRHAVQCAHGCPWDSAHTGQPEQHQ